MALVRVGRKAAIDLDRVRAIRIDDESATVFFAGGVESVTFANRDGEWSSMIEALPEVGRLYPDQAEGGPDSGAGPAPAGSVGFGG